MFEILVEKGGVVLQPLKKYLLAAESISWPLRVLDKIVATKDEVISVLAEVMQRHEPGYERDPTKKIQLLNHLAGIKDPRVPALVVPYLADMDEGVRYTAAEALLKQGDEAAACEPLLAIFVSGRGREPAPAHQDRRRVRRARLAARRQAGRGREAPPRRFHDRGPRQGAGAYQEEGRQGITCRSEPTSRPSC